MPQAADTTEMQKLERGLAFEHATSIIESNCLALDEEKHPELDACRDWFDLSDTLCTTEDEVTEAASYLSWRGLLERAAENPQWVAVKDEHEADA